MEAYVPKIHRWIFTLHGFTFQEMLIFVIMLWDSYVANGCTATLLQHQAGRYAGRWTAWAADRGSDSSSCLPVPPLGRDIVWKGELVLPVKWFSALNTSRRPAFLSFFISLSLICHLLVIFFILDICFLFPHFLIFSLLLWPTNPSIKHVLEDINWQ